MCDWYTYPAVTVVPFSQSVLLFATTVCQATCASFDLSYLHTKCRVVMISSGFLIVQCLWAEREPIRPPLAPVTENCRKHPSLGPWCFQWAEEQHPPWLINERNAIFWSSTPGIGSGSYTRTVTCKEDANIYQDMGALQILEIWMFLKQAKTACYWLTLPAYWISGGKTSLP